MEPPHTPGDTVPAHAEPGPRPNRWWGLLPAALVLGFAAFAALAICVPRGGSERITLPPPSDGGEGALAGDPLAGRTVEIVAIVPRDRIAAIINPRFGTAAEAGRRLADDEPVVGLEINGEARAYSTYQLSRHEIVNDVVGGVPVAVTW